MKATPEMIEAFMRSWANVSPSVSWYSKDVEKAFNAALAVMPAPQPMAVKLLEWRNEPVPPAGEILASSVVGLYCIRLGHAGRFYVWVRDRIALGNFDTLEAAKTAAQAHLETLVLSALTTPPADIDRLREENERLKQSASYSAEWASQAMSGMTVMNKQIGEFQEENERLRNAVERLRNETIIVNIEWEKALASVREHKARAILAERERCAKVCDDRANDDFRGDLERVCYRIAAAAIRRGGQ